MSDDLKSVLPRIPPGDIKHGANMREIGSTWNQSGAATLVKYDSVCRALAEVKSIDEVLEIRNASIAMKAYAKQANNHELERDAIEIRMRATRRMDQMRQEQARTIGLAKGGQPYQKKSTKPIFSFDETDENISEIESVSTGATTVPVETIPLSPKQVLISISLRKVASLVPCLTLTLNELSVKPEVLLGRPPKKPSIP